MAGIPGTQAAELRAADVVVIGADQAGLSAAYHLQRRGFRPAGESGATAGPAMVQDSPGTYVVLDAEAGPGGAWRHRWKSLRMATVNGISDLPGIPKPDVDPAEPSSGFLSRYFGDYEEGLGLNIMRPVRVRSVSREDDNPWGRLRIESSAGAWSARAVVNATGTWTRWAAASRPSDSLMKYPRSPPQAGSRAGNLCGAKQASTTRRGTTP